MCHEKKHSHCYNPCREERRHDHCNGRVEIIQPICIEGERTREIVRSRQVIRHRHDVIREHDVVHEHDIHYHDVFRRADVVRRHESANTRPIGIDRRDGRDSIEFSNYEGSGYGRNYGGEIYSDGCHSHRGDHCCDKRHHHKDKHCHEHHHRGCW